MKIYGISNCDTVKKAKKWCDAAGVVYEFHDYKKHGVDEAILAKAVELFGWEAVLNRRGTTWRKLDDLAKAAVVDAKSAIAVMVEHSSMIKRPLVAQNDGEMLLGFSVDEYQQKLG